MAIANIRFSKYPTIKSMSVEISEKTLLSNIHNMGLKLFLLTYMYEVGSNTNKLMCCDFIVYDFSMTYFSFLKRHTVTHRTRNTKATAPAMMKASISTAELSSAVEVSTGGQSRKVEYEDKYYYN